DGVLADQDAHGTITSRLVGPPAGLSRRNVPPAARMRLVMPSRPPPGCTCAPPMPLSSTRAHSPPSRERTTMRHSLARECLAALVSDSAMAKYTAASASRHPLPAPVTPG